MPKNITFFKRIFALILLALAFGFSPANAQASLDPATAVRLEQLELRIAALEAEGVKPSQARKVHPSTADSRATAQGWRPYEETLAYGVVVSLALSLVVIFSKPTGTTARREEDWKSG